MSFLLLEYVYISTLATDVYDVFEIVDCWNCHFWPHHSQHASKWNGQQASPLKREVRL